MEVISLNERERSTTILNTTPPSDSTADGLDDLALDNGENVTPFDDNDDSTIADDSEAADADANTGAWTKKNKLLASIIAGTALLCAVGAGGGVAAHNARMNADAANYCPAPVAPPVDAISGGGGAKASKASGSAKASKSSLPVLTDSLVVEEEVEVSAINLEVGGVRRGLVANNNHQQEVVVTPIGGEGAYYHIPKVVEDKRKNRMLAEHLGHRAVVTSSFSWGDYLNGVKFGFGGGRRLGLEDVVSEVEEIGDGEEEVTVGEAEDPSVVAANGGGSKGSKSGSGGSKGSKSVRIPELGEGVQCKCDPAYVGGSIGTKAAKAESASKSAKTQAPAVDEAITIVSSVTTKSAKSGSSPSKAGKSGSSGLAYSPTACGNIGGPTPSSKSVGNIVQEPKVSTKSVKEPPTPSVPAPSPPVSPPATVTKPPTEPVVKPPTDPSPSPPTPSVNPPTPATEPNPPTEPTEPSPSPPTEPTEPSPSPPTPGSGGGEPNPPTPPVNPPTPATKPNPPTPPVNPPTPATEPNPPTPPTEPSPSPPTPGSGGSGGGEPNPPTPPVNPPTPATEPNPPTPPTEPSPSPPTPGSGGGEPNCENDDDWTSTNGETCEDVANDTGLCDNDDGDLAASDACPKSCNPECRIPIIPIPVGSPTNPPITLETNQPTVGATVTVGDPESSAPTGGSRGETEPPTTTEAPTPSSDGIAPPPPTPMPTGLSTSLSTGLSTGTASFGGTVTVSTETTGPPTTEIRPCGEDGDCDQ